MLSFMALDYYRTHPLLGYSLFALAVFMFVFFLITLRTVLANKETYAAVMLLPLRSDAPQTDPEESVMEVRS